VPAVAAIEVGMKKYSILLVDDDAAILESTGQYLEERGYEIKSASSGEMAIEMLQTVFCHLVITDLVMETVNGIEVLKFAKKLRPETMGIVLTGFGDMTTAIEALRLGVDDYLLKPCSPEELELRVARCFEKLELNRKIKSYEKILPLCCVCKSIRDDSGREPGTGTWMALEEYVWRKAGVAPSSTYCPECAKKIDPEA
jgi:DNA-binding NtrC family response regulator